MTTEAHAAAGALCRSLETLLHYFIDAAVRERVVVITPETGVPASTVKEVSDDLVDIAQAAEMTHLSPATVRYYVQNQTECGVYFGHLGRRRMAKRSDIELWIKKSMPTRKEG